MCHCSVLWPFVSLYVPSFRSMDLHLVLCAIVLFYGPSSCSMCHHSVLWTFIPLCAIVLFYGASSRSMCHRFVLLRFLFFYVPSFRSLDLHLVQCVIVLFYGPSSFSLCRPPVL